MVSTRLGALRCPECGTVGAFYRQIDYTETVEENVEIHQDPAGQRIVKGTGDYRYPPSPPSSNDRWVSCGDCGHYCDVDDLTDNIYECRSCGFIGPSEDGHDDAKCPDPDVHPLDPIRPFVDCNKEEPMSEHDDALRAAEKATQELKDKKLLPWARGVPPAFMAEVVSEMESDPMRPKEMNEEILRAAAAWVAITKLEPMEREMRHIWLGRIVDYDLLNGRQIETCGMTWTSPDGRHWLQLFGEEDGRRTAGWVECKSENARHTAWWDPAPTPAHFKAANGELVASGDEVVTAVEGVVALGPIEPNEGGWEANLQRESGARRNVDAVMGFEGEIVCSEILGSKEQIDKIGGRDWADGVG